MFWAAIIPIISNIFGSDGLLTQYAKSKADERQKEQNYKLAVLQAQTDQVAATVAANAQELTTRLTSTSQSFKQTTFYMLVVPVLLTMLAPKYAVTMWANFNLMPIWFQNLFISVYSAIWGLPLLGKGYGLISSYVSDKRDYKLEKARIDRKAVYDELKAKMYTKGVSQDQVEFGEKLMDIIDDEK